MRSLRVSTVLAAASLFVACPTITLPDAPMVECTFNSDCPEKKICAAGGTCVDECKADRDCGVADLVCVMGACTAKQGVCREDRQCGAGEKCTNTGSCAKACAIPADCGDGFACLDGACVSQTASCTRDTECPSAKVCGGRGACATPCSMDTQCAASESCSAGACVPKPTACPSGNECTAPETCATGSCVRACTTAVDCGAGRVCTSGTCVLLPATCVAAVDCPTGKGCANGLCADACVGTRDCRDGLVCSFGVCVAPGSGCLTDMECTGGKVCSPNAECVAACTAQAQCASGEVCSNGACVVTGATSATLAGTVQLTGLSAHDGITVTVRGPSNAKVTTSADGSYRFEGLKAGRYDLTFAAPSTKEQQLAIEAAAGAGAVTTVPMQQLTPVGRLRGNVKLTGSASHHGVQVALVGQNLVTTTQPSGDFEFTAVPLGSFQLLVTTAFYVPAMVAATAVTYNMTAVQPSITLVPQPTTTGAVFSFVTTPPEEAVIGRPYVYTAIAGGGGITGPTYAVLQGPPGFTIDGPSGVVGYTPSSSGSYFVILQASTPSATVYQLFHLSIGHPFTEVISQSVYASANSGVDSWYLHSDSVSFLVDGGGTAPDGGAQRINLGLGAISRTATSVELLNGASISSLSYLGGTLTQVTGPVGSFSARFQGGEVTQLTHADRFLFASREALPSVSQVAIVDGELITGFTMPSGTVQSFTDGRAVPSSIRAETGVASAVTAQVLTEDSAAWGAGGLVGRCLVNSRQGGYFSITANTATSITVGSGSDLSTILGVGDRYFVINCGTGQARYTITQNGASFGTLTSQYVDLYAGGLALGSYLVSSSTSTTVTFEAPVTSFGDVLSVPALGFYAISPSAGHSVVLNDAAGNFAASLSSTNRLSFDGNSTGYAITANTATAITFTVNRQQLHRLLPGLTWRLTDTSNRTPVTFSFSGTSFGAGAFVGRTLFTDANAGRWPITANTTTTVTALIDASQFPLTWRSTYAAVTAGSNTGPTVRLTSPQAITSLSQAGTTYYRVTSPTASPGIVSKGTVRRQTGNTVEVELPYFSANVVREAVTTSVGSFIGMGVSGPRFGITVQGAPGWVPGSLVNRELSFAATGESITIADNSANQLWVEGTGSDFSSFYTLQPGEPLLVPGVQNTYRVTIASAGSSFTPGALVGLHVINPQGQSLGPIVGNTGTTVDVTVNNSTALANLGVGARFAFSNPANASGCNTAGRIAATATLTGATLTANGYQTLEVASSSYTVTSNTTGELSFTLCGSQLGSLLSQQGQLGAATNVGVVMLTLTDANAAFAPNAFAGKSLTFYDNGVSRGPLVGSNTATALQVPFSGAEFRNLASRLTAGQRFVAGEANSRVAVAVTVGSTLTPNALANSRAELRMPSSNWVQLTVNSNTANVLNGLLSDTELATIRPLVGFAAEKVRFSEGVLMRIVDSSASFTPNALMARIVRVGNRDLEIISNTATELLAWSSDENIFELSRGVTSYQVRANSPSAAATVVGSELLVGTFTTVGPMIARVTKSGVAGYSHPFNTGRALALRPLGPRIVGNTVSVVDNGVTVVVSDPTLSLTPGALVGDYLVTADSLTSIIVANTATTISVLRTSFISLGLPFRIVRTRLSVPAGGLTANAFTGKRLRLMGIDYPIRSNGVADVQVSIPFVSNFSPPMELLPPDGVSGFVLEGLDNDVSVAALRPAGAGWAAATSTGLVTFDGTGFSRLGEVDNATQLATGPVTGFTTNSITTSATLVPNALVGKRLVLHSGIFTINANSTNIISLSTSSYGWYFTPSVGDTFRVIDTNGTNVINDVAVTSTDLHLATSRGLFTRSGSSWARRTVASTESMLGAADGLPCDSPNFVEHQSATNTLWIGCGGVVAGLTGSTWSRLTPENTASMPGAYDGYPGGTLRGLTFTSNGIWFATNAGAAKLTGSSWIRANLLPEAGVSLVWQGPGGDTLFATSGGVYRPAP